VVWVRVMVRVRVRVRVARLQCGVGGLMAEPVREGRTPAVWCGMLHGGTSKRREDTCSVVWDASWWNQ
jgi:hypothetical protein